MQQGGFLLPKHNLLLNRESRLRAGSSNEHEKLINNYYKKKGCPKAVLSCAKEAWRKAATNTTNG